MEGFIITIVLFVLAIIAVVAPKFKKSNIAEEDKEAYTSAINKISKTDKVKKNFKSVGILIYLVIACIMILVMSLSNGTVSQDTGLGVATLRPIRTVDNIFCSVLSMTTLYILVYTAARIIFEFVVVRRKIKKNPDLTDKERHVLLNYYTTSVFTSIGWALILEVVPQFLRIITTTADKPIIYIYPDEKKRVTVRVENPENLIHTYPEYNDGWEVEADVDGTLTDVNGKKYYSLYWEGINRVGVDQKVGFCIKGEDTAAFLEEKLEALGLNYKERQEFIVYWLPQMENNKYNYVYFMQTNEVDSIMSLDINPKPDSLIRVMMYYKPLLFKETNLKEQVFKPVEREGYTVVEWGGTKIR